jgi:hypothetical protein
MKSTIVAGLILLVVFFVFPSQFLTAGIALLVGWNVLEQPEWVREFWRWAVDQYATIRAKFQR